MVVLRASRRSARFLYTAKALSIIATKFKLNFYWNGSSLHLLTEKELPDDLFQQLAKGGLAAVNKVSLLQNDLLKAVSKVTSVQTDGKIQLALHFKNRKIFIRKYYNSCPKILLMVCSFNFIEQELPVYGSRC